MYVVFMIDKKDKYVKVYCLPSVLLEKETRSRGLITTNTSPNFCYVLTHGINSLCASDKPLASSYFSFKVYIGIILLINFRIVIEINSN